MKLKLILLIQLRRDWEDSFLGRSRASKRKERTRDGIRATILARFFARSAQWGSFNATGEQRGIANVCRRVLTPSFPLTTCGLLASLSLSLSVCVYKLACTVACVHVEEGRGASERASERVGVYARVRVSVRACWPRVVPMTDQREVRVVNTWYVTVQGTRPLTDAVPTQPVHCPPSRYRTHALYSCASIGRSRGTRLTDWTEKNRSIPFSLFPVSFRNGEIVD